MVISLKHQQILEDRGLDVELLATLGVETSADSREWLVIPYLQNGRVVNRKYRRFNHAERFRQDSGGKQCLWNFDVLLDRTLDHLPLIITEGEFDAMAAIQAGFPRTVSVPGGAPGKPQGVDGEGGKYAFLDEAMPLLREAKRIIIAADGDEVGANLLQDLSHRLGRPRCQFLRYPKFLYDHQRQKHDHRERCKDLNEVLETYGASGVVEVVNAAEFIRVGGLYRMSELPPLPIVGAFDVGMAGLAPHFKIRLGDLSVVTGIPSHGKTSFANEIAFRMALPMAGSEEAESVLGLLPWNVQGTLLDGGKPMEDCGYGWTVALASFEQRAKPDLLLNLRRFRARCHPDALSKTALDAVDEWIDRHFVLIVPDEDEDASLPWFMERSAAAMVQYGARLVVCDPWNELDHVRPPDMSLTEYTGFAIKQFRKQASKYQAHHMVVAHPTKLGRSSKAADGTSELPCPTLYDISDSAHWYNKTDAGIVVHRETLSSTLIHVQKTRYEAIGKPGKLRATFLTGSRRYEIDTSNEQPQGEL